MLDKMTFKQQMWLGMGILLCGFMLSNILKQGIISNIGWILFGLLFIIHPICPESWKWRYGDDDKRMRRDYRIAGAIVIIVGLMIRFGV